MPDYRCNSAKPVVRPAQMPPVRCDRDASHPGPHRNGSCVWEEPTPTTLLPTKEDVKIRMWAVEQVIAWASTFENSDAEDDWVDLTPTLIVTYARVFEDYVKGEL